MAQYTGLFFSLAIIILVVLLNKVLFWWAKSLIAMYYFVTSFVFIKVKNNLDEQYVANFSKDNVIPSVSIDYWDKNSDLVGITTLCLFIQVIIIVSFVHFKQYKKVENKGAKLFVLLRLLLSVALFFILGFMFNLAYGMSP